jgi:hypothetical protein
MKCKIFIIFYFFASVSAYSLDMSFDFYLPSLSGITSGDVETFSSFENNASDSRYLMPIENKICIFNYNDEYSISVNSILSLYIEDKSFNSINGSAGISFFSNQFQSLSMTGVFFSLYPVYEIPIIYDYRNKRSFDWKMAFDFGYSIALFKLLQINIYTRFQFVWLDSDYESMLDLGISLGFRIY